MHKLDYQSDTEWKKHSFARIYEYECSESSEGVPRIVAGAPNGEAAFFKRLTLCLNPPYYLLYVLHTPRGEGDPGRYQSPSLSAGQLCEFIERFKLFLSADARFDIWAYSPSENATVVWERHNLIYAYGRLDKISTELSSMGFSTGEVNIPFPHQHHYRHEMDEEAKSLLTFCEWSYSPLQAEDKQ